MAKFKAFVLIILFFFISLQTQAQKQVANSTKDSDTELRKLVGQMFVLGFNGSTSTEDLKNIINRYYPGGIIVFGRNIKTQPELKKLLSFAQYEAKRIGLPELFIAVDQEGGVVSRIKTLPPLPSALAIGNANIPELTRQLGFLTGSLLRNLGFNMNLAPVLDLADLNRTSFIGNRSFGAVPENVASHVKAFGAGLVEAGVIPTSKHFPGHGNIEGDSHKTLPRKQASIDDLKASDLVPYKSFFEIEGPKALMVAHLSLPGVDPSGTPATFSKPILSGLLREGLKYEGLIVTDDLEMEGAKANTTSANSTSVQSILAGADLIMIAWNRNSQKLAIQSVVDAVKAGTISIERIKESLARIENHKRQIKQFVQKNSTFSYADFTRNLQKVTNKVVYASLAKAVASNVSLAKDLKKYNELVFISSEQKFFNSFVRADPSLNVSFIKNNFQLTNSQILDRLKKNKSSLLIFLVNGRKSMFTLGRIPELYSERILVVNTDDPGLVSDPQKYFAVLNVSSRHPELGYMFYSSAWDQQKRRISWEP